MSKKLVKLFKRPSQRYQDLNTFTISMEEFVSMAQGRIDRIYVHDQNNGLRVRLDVKEVLKKASVTALVSSYTGWGYYIVDYSPLNKKETPPEKRKVSKSRANTPTYLNTEDSVAS